ncbi:MAG: TatD family hydrolase [Desulfurococcaceae archaeon]
MPVKPMNHASLIDLYRWLLDNEYKRVTSLGLRAMVGLGIHPRNIPSDWREALSYIEEILRAYSYAILGEVGFELGSEVEVEVEVLREQLRIAKKSDRPVILHSPRRNELVIVKKLLKIVESSGLSEGLVIIDHLKRKRSMNYYQISRGTA